MMFTVKCSEGVEEREGLMRFCDVVQCTGANLGLKKGEEGAQPPTAAKIGEFTIFMTCLLTFIVTIKQL